MYYPVKKRLLVSNLGNMRSDGSCNIARGGKLTNKIAVDDEQKFPRVIFSEGKKKGNYYATVTYRIIIGPLGQRFTCFVIDTIDTRLVI